MDSPQCIPTSGRLSADQIRSRRFVFWLWAANIVIALAMATMVARTVAEHHASRHAEARSRNHNLTLLLEHNVRALLAKTDVSLRTVAHEVARQAAAGRSDAGRLRETLEEQAGYLAEATRLRIADAEGNIVLGKAPGDDSSISLADRKFFIEARDHPESGLIIDGPHRSRFHGRWVLVLARRLSAPDGHFLGTVSAGIDVDRFRDLFAAMDLGEHGSAVLRDAEFRVIARFSRAPEKTPSTGTTHLPQDYVDWTKRNPDTASYFSRGAFDGIERLVTYRRVAPYPLYVLVGQAPDDYLGDWREILLPGASLALMAVFIMVLTSVAIHRLWSRQLHITAALRGSEKSAREARALFQEAVDSVATGFAIYDRDDRLLTCNAAYRNFYQAAGDAIVPGARFEDIVRAGVQRGLYPEAEGNAEEWTRRRVAWHQGAHGTAIEQALDDGRQLLNVEYRTPSGLIVANRIDISELHRYRRSLEDAVVSRTAELEASTRQFRATFEQAAVGIAQIGLDYRWLRINRRLYDMLGYRPEELQDLTFVDITHPDDVDLDLKHAGRLLAGEISSYAMEKRYIRKNGSIVWGKLTGTLVRTPDGRPDYFIAVIEDIQRRKDAETALEAERESHRRLLEQQVAERTAELVAVNKELQGFTYAASHDMRAPLGRINSFGILLEKQYRDRLEGDGLMFLDFIRRNTLRLMALVDDLLAHAQIEQKIMERQAVDLRGAVAVVMSEREAEMRENRVELCVDVPPVTVQGNTHGLAQVLRNLVENAIKYSSRQPAPRIVIGAEVEDGRCRLWVSDNGIGFDMAYHDRIFEIFRRLHTYEEYPGSGIGLALVKKAMERMGGRIWAESAPGCGATFYIELPAEREAVTA